MTIDTRSDVEALAVQKQPPDPLLADHIQLTLLITLFLIGAPINLVSFTKLWQRRALRSTGRLAILKLHLNIADLMILFIYVTSTACWQITFQWRGGDLLCKCIKFLHSTSFQLSSNIMVAVALDRLVTIVRCNISGSRRQRFRSTRRSSRRSHRSSSKKGNDESALKYVRLFVYVAWIAAIVLNLPQFAIWRVYAPFEHRSTWRQCVTIWAIPPNRFDATWASKNGTNATMIAPTIISQFTYDVLQLVFVFWTPATLLVVSYVIIMLYLQRLCVKERRSSLKKPTEPLALPGSCSKVALVHDRHQQKRMSAPYEIAHDEKKIDVNHSRVRINRKSKQGSQDEDETNVDAHTHRKSVDPRKSICSATSSTVAMTSDDHTEKEVRKASRDEVEAITMPANIQLVRKKTFRTSMMLIFAYLLFWLPYNVMALWWFIDTDGYRRYGFSLKFLNVLIVLNSVVNPFIYGTLGRRWYCVK